MKIVYITGCLGFIGSYVTRQCLARNWKVIGVDKQTYASNLDFLDEFQANPNFKYIHSDINDIDRLYDCDYIINTAAESHVDNSIMSSAVFLKSNINGVHHLLELIRQIPDARRPTFLHFSTDEVYGDIVSGSHTENDLLRPSNPYSASKAAADMLVLAWARTHGIRYIIVRPTNNYGIGQYVEKLIPKSIKFLSIGKKIDLHDNGNPARVWLHASDTASAVLHLIDCDAINEIYNISGNIEMPNKEVIKKILALYHNRNCDDEWQQFIINRNRVGQDLRYSIDDSKLKNLGWQARANFDHELEGIVRHYRTKFVW